MKNLISSLWSKGTPGWLFLAFDLDAQQIRDVRRVAAADKQWSDWNNFVEEQVARALQDLLHLPNERIYAFSCPSLERIPLISGADNNHFIEVVRQFKPTYQLTLLEAAYAIEQGIRPTELRSSDEHYNAYADYVAGLQSKRDWLRFVQTVDEDSHNYAQLYDLAYRYSDDEAMVQQQIDYLNKSMAGLRIFSVLEDVYRSSDYVQHHFKWNDYEALIRTPVQVRTGLHYLKAELDKVDLQAGRIFTDCPDREERLLELTLYIRRLEIPSRWRKEGPERPWLSACLARLTDVDSISRELVNFGASPLLTRTQLQYLIRTGTTDETLYQSGIMRNVVMKTRFFQEQFGFDLAGCAERKLDNVDMIIIAAGARVIQEEYDRVAADTELPDQEEQLQWLEAALDTYQSYLTDDTSEPDQPEPSDWSEKLARFDASLEGAARYYRLHPFAQQGDFGSESQEALAILEEELSDDQVETLLEHVVHMQRSLPVEYLLIIRGLVLETHYGKREEFTYKLREELRKAKCPLEPFYALSVYLFVQKGQQHLEDLQKELAEKQETERRINREINELYRNIDIQTEHLDFYKKLDQDNQQNQKEECP